MSEMEQDEKRAYDALLELVDEAKRHLDNLKTDPDPKRPDIPPGIPQSILPVLRRIIQEAQVFKGLLRAPIKTKAARDKHIEEGKKRRREDPAEVQSGVARSQERQNMKDKLDELGTHLWNRTLLMNRVAKLAKEAATQVDNDYSRTQTRRDALAEWDKLFAYSRYAAYALIQVAGDDRKGIVRFIMRGLELATKTALALFASKEQEKSREVLTSAAELEDVLANKLQKGLDGLSDDRLLRQDCNRHIIDYYLARCSLQYYHIETPFRRKPVVAVYRYFLSAALKDAEDARRKLASRIFLALVLFLQKQQATFFTGPELQRALDGMFKNTVKMAKAND
ncbi:hypothetical protein QFC19_001260 [Naganishia cerealis]|uniref:Uncharacterized protein n=1 Tax=Naganishia cerealis TaxID=610337 RepID=A0ACC2WKI7_9TREE|nr:hypothetical protein QFC19_001260 [Naganishia cerealis]